MEAMFIPFVSLSGMGGTRGMHRNKAVIAADGLVIPVSEQASTPMTCRISNQP